jgi:hypothetical protein
VQISRGQLTRRCSSGRDRLRSLFGARRTFAAAVGPFAAFPPAATTASAAPSFTSFPGGRFCKLCRFGFWLAALLGSCFRRGRQRSCFADCRSRGTTRWAFLFFGPGWALLLLSFRTFLAFATLPFAASFPGSLTAASCTFELAFAAGRLGCRLRCGSHGWCRFSFEPSGDPGEQRNLLPHDGCRCSRGGWF